MRERAKSGRAGEGGSGRAFRGLVLVFLLSFVNLIGLVVTLTVLGGLEPWSPWQFVGMFGVLEAASGLANVISPNIWRLPIAELETGDRARVTLAASAMLLPHWGGIARFTAGVVLIVPAAWREGVGPASLGLVPFVLGLAAAILAVSALVARAGVARPDLDVVQLIVRRAGGDRELNPISIGALCLQFLLGIVTVPVAKLLPPTVLYQPELAPSAAALLVILTASVTLVALAAWSWSGRIRTQAPRAQQREAEEHA